MGISSPGIGSGLDVNGIITKLMNVESAPLQEFDKKTQSYQAKLSAYGSLSGAIAAFQGALSTLNTASAFKSVNAASSDTSVATATTTNAAKAGTYKINVTQVAQAQTLISSGLASATTAIGSGTATRLTFELGSVSGGVFGIAGTALGAGVTTSGLATGALSINGTTIPTDSTVKSAKLLADAINGQSATTGVTANVATTQTSATLFSTFGSVDTSGGGTYSLSVGGINLASQATGVAAGSGVTAASIDATLAGNNGVTQALAAANITFTGTAAAGTLRFSNSDGNNINVSETVTGTVNGGIGLTSAQANSGSTVTASSTVTLVSGSGNPITIGGGNPAQAGFTAGTAGSYIGATFTQDGTAASGSVVIDSSNNTLSGIRDAINQAGLGVTASIVSDGSATPNRLVLTSNKTGAKSTLKVQVDGVSGGPDATLQSLFAYDAGGTQNLSQTAAALSTSLTVNGIAVQSDTGTVTSAIPGVTLNVNKLGSTTLSVSQDASSARSNVSTFVKAYNDLNAAIKKLSGYDPDTKTGGPLLGDDTVRNLQAGIRKQLGTTITGLTGSFTSLSQIGISFQKDGTLTVDQTKLSNAITSNLGDITALFAAVGSASDTLVTYDAGGANTQAGKYDLNVTQLARQASYTSAAAIGASTTIAANTTWTVTLNDTSPSSPSSTATVSIAAGTYTPSQLAATIQSAINGASAFSSAGSTVSASIDGSGKLVLSTTRYGSAANLSLTAATGTDVATVFGAGTALTGQDVAGTLGGYAFTGSGQTATGAVGSPVEGLKFDVTGGAVGARGTISYSKGYGDQLYSLTTGFLGADGLITGKTNGINASIKDVAKRRDDFASRLDDIEKRYRAQFTALDTAVASMNSTASFLTQQLASLAKSTS